MAMSLLITIVITLVVVGLLLWAVQSLPIDPTIANIIRVLVIVFAVLWVIGALTGYGPGWRWR
jgi:hypothetical protein